MIDPIVRNINGRTTDISNFWELDISDLGQKVLKSLDKMRVDISDCAAKKWATVEAGKSDISGG